MARLVVCVDCDEVLCKFVEGINTWHARVHGVTLPLSAYTSTHFARVPGWGSDAVADAKVQDFFRGSAEWLGLEPLPGAREALAALKRACPALDLQVVTARSARQREDTLAWLAAHFPGLFSAVHFLSAYDNADKVDAPAKSKGQVCRELGALALIDDSPTYCITAAPHVPLVLLFSRVAWNTGQAAWEHPALPRNVVRAPGWALAGAVLQRLCSVAAAAGPLPQQPLALVPPSYAPGSALDASALALPAAAYHSLAAGAAGGSLGSGGGGGGAAAAPGVGPSAPPAVLQVQSALEVMEGAVQVRAPLEAPALAALEAQLAALVAAGLGSVVQGPAAGLFTVTLLHA